MNSRLSSSSWVTVSVFVVVLSGCSGGLGAITDATERTTSLVESSTTAENLSVHFVDVGQGASVLVVGPTGETLLYDTGNWNDDGELVLDYLRARNVTRIDYLVTSHADADHVGGHAEVIDYYETEADGIGAIYDPGITAATRTYEAYLDAVEAHDVTLYRAQAGDAIPMEGATVRVLSPPEGYLASRERNENSLVLRVEYGNASVLLPGDAEGEAERYLTGIHAGRLNATVLAAGHHGSNTSTGPGFLAETTPRVVAIQSAYDSPYGHPHRELLARLAEREIPTYWTGVHGTVVFETDGKRVVVRTQHDAPTDALELRTAPGVESTADSPLERRETFVVAPSSEASGTSTVVADGGQWTEVDGRQTVDGDQRTTDADQHTVDGGQQTAGGGQQTVDGDQRTVAPSGALAVAEIHADARGDEDENLNDEYVVFRNAGNRALDLSGWTVSDEAGHSYTFPGGTTLAPGETLTLHTGGGTDTDTDFYWGSGRPVWNNAGDTVFVRTDEGTLVLEVEYDE